MAVAAAVVAVVAEFAAAAVAAAAAAAHHETSPLLEAAKQIYLSSCFCCFVFHLYLLKDRQQVLRVFVHAKSCGFPLSPAVQTPHTAAAAAAAA